MNRGTLVMAVMAGDYGKVRPAVVVQADAFEALKSIIVCPLTSNVATLGPLRVRLDPDETNGLHQPSLVMVEKPMAIDRARLRASIGTITSLQLAMVDERLAIVLGLAD